MATQFAGLYPKPAAKPGAKPAAAKPAAGKPAAAAAKPAVGQIDTRPRSMSPPGPAVNSNPQRAISPPNSARGVGGGAGRGSPTTNPRAPLDAAKNKAAYGTIIRNWGNQTASKANLSMLEKKNLLPLVALHRNNNVKVQSVASEVIDALVELPDGTISMEPSKVNGFRPLVDLCKRDDIDAEVPILVVQSLAHLAAHPACRAPIMNEIGWFNVPKFMRAPEQDMKMACAMLLGNLSHEPKNQKPMIEKGVPLLLECLKEANNTELKAALYSSLADVSLIKDFGAQQIWEENLLQYVLPSIMNDGAQDEQSIAVSLLSNIVDTQNTSVHRQVIDSGVTEKLYALLKQDSDELQSNISLVFARIGKTGVGRQKMETLPSFKSLLEVLTSSKNALTQFQVCGALDVLVDSDVIKTVLKKEDAVDSLEEVILSTTVHAQVEELAMVVLKKLDSEHSKIVADKLEHTVKERPAAPPVIPIIGAPISPRAVEAAETHTLSFSPRKAPDVNEVFKAGPSSEPPRGRSNSKANTPLASFSNPGTGLDAGKMQKDHELEVVKLQEEKKRLEELLRKEREAEREASKYVAASPGSNIDDKIKGSLKSIQESINLEVDLLGNERQKIEAWKRAIENYKGDRIIYEKDLEILRKDKDHLEKERGSFASDMQNIAADKERLEREKNATRAENDRIAKENERLRQEIEDLAKAREKLNREKSEYDRERELLAKGNSDQSAIDRERAERERQRAEEAERAREKAEKELKRSEQERAEMEEMLEKERRRFKEELERERRRLEEEAERAASAANVGKDAVEKEKAFREKERYYEEIQLQFEKDKKKLEKEKARLEEELEDLRSANGKSADEASQVSELKRMMEMMEETLEETRRTNKLLQGRVEELEDELKNGQRDRSQSDAELAALSKERKKLEELARKLQEEREEFERAKQAKDDNGDDEGRELDLDERQRKELAAQLKKLEEWEKAKEKEKEENQKRLEEEIELLRLRHASWERKKAIVMADLIAKENEIFERESKLQKLDDELYEREVRVTDIEKRPARRAEYSDSDDSRTRSDDDSRRYSDYTNDQTITDSSEESDYTIDSPRDRRRRSRDDERDRDREREREKERQYDLEREREKEREREREKKRKANKLKKASSSKPKSDLKASKGSNKGSPKARPPFADYLDPMEDGQIDDDEDDMFSVEGLAQSDPYEAARKLLALLELDPSRATESTLESVRKFAKNRSGAPSQYEARDIIPALVHILRLCTSASHEEIILTCLLILAILAYNKDANQLYIRRAKGYDVFEFYLTFNLFTVQARAALTIAAYCLNNIPIKNEIGQSAVPKLVNMLKDPSSGIRKSAAAALATLVDNNRYNKKIVKKMDGVKMLLDLLKDNQIPPKYALHLLASLAHDSKKIKAQVPKHFPNVFRKIVLLLSPYTKPSVLAGAVAALMELARNNQDNQKQIFKAGATKYLVTILISKDRYNNDELIANTLFLCWVIGKIAPKGLANPEFETDGKWTMAEILSSLKEINNEAVKKIIFNMESMIRTAGEAKGVLGSSSGVRPHSPSSAPGIRGSSAVPPSPLSSSSSAPPPSSPAIPIASSSSSVPPASSSLSSSSPSPALSASATVNVPAGQASISASGSVGAS